MNNISKYKFDLERLINKGDILLMAFQYECFPDDFIHQLNNLFKDKKNKQKLINEYLNKLPNFSSEYQNWYSEALYLVHQLLPKREDDFVILYKKPKRKDITYENYVIEDALLGLEVSKNDIFEEKKIIVDKKAAIPKFQQQLNILKSIKKRFESSLFDIKQLVQADLFDNELDVAIELNKKGFIRAAGAVAGVVLEAHLAEVCRSHKIIIRKKNPGINDLAQLLKGNDVISTDEWRKIQHLADLRNLCDHKKQKEPTKEDIDELIAGVSRVIKNIF